MNIFMSLSVNIGVKVLSDILREIILISSLNEYKNKSEIKCIAEVHYVRGFQLLHILEICSVARNVSSAVLVCQLYT
jgi:hypothetical protein